MSFEVKCGIAFLQSEKIGDPFCTFVSLSKYLSLSPLKYFFLENLFTLGSFPSDHIPKDLATHGQILDGHISNLNPPLNFGLHNLVPGHQMQFLFIISATLPEKMTEQLRNLICNGLGSKED